jgi:glutamine amidotransferase
VIAIIDYGLGNLRSVAGAVARLGGTPLITSRITDLERAEKLILPGVGAFGDGMARLARLGLIDALTRIVIDERRPILGICLGAQLMADESDEFGRHRGLGWLRARVTRIVPRDPALRVPHVGWNEMRQLAPSALFTDVPDGALFYFVHSYQICCDDTSMVVGTCEYGDQITAVLQRDNLYGTQFHPEKSQRHGLSLLDNFLKDA